MLRKDKVRTQPTDNAEAASLEEQPIAVDSWEHDVLQVFQNSEDIDRSSNADNEH